MGTRTAPPNPNHDLTLSDAGRTQLVRHEGLIRHYYNDSVHNCTYGVGTLAHLGPCTNEELHTQVTDAQLVSSLQAGVNAAQATVRRNVNTQRLTQAQFDSLVSFVYNVGAGGARNVMNRVNQGDLQGAAHQMSQFTRATVRDAHGRPVRDRNGHVVTRELPGLVRRRRDETAPFVPQTAPNAAAGQHR